MNIPTIAGVIDRRILVNFRVRPDALQSLLPPPFRPKLVVDGDGESWGVAGICLIRLKQVRPVGLPGWVGIGSENAAHRVAVEWGGDVARGRSRCGSDEESLHGLRAGAMGVEEGLHGLRPGATGVEEGLHGLRPRATGVEEGVYVLRRDTDSWLNSVAGGRVFPGVHHRSRFEVQESGDRFKVALVSDDGETQMSVAGRLAEGLPAGSIFGSPEEASRFFETGVLGYSPGRRPGEFEGLELRCHDWRAEPLEVESIS